MDVGTISTRYARALFSLALEKKLETRLYDDIKMLADSFIQEPGLKTALDNPILSPREKERLLTAAAGIEVCELYTRFIELVIKYKRENMLIFIVHIYIRMYRKEKKITRVQFNTAVQVDEDIKRHLKNRLLEKTGGNIEFIGNVQPELTGGFVLRIGNYRIDASFTSKLRDIRRQLLTVK